MRKYIIPLTLSGFLAFVSCGKKTEETAAEPPAELEVPEVVETIPGVVSAEQRAAKLGFAKYLPKNISAYSALINGRETLEKMLQTPMGVMLCERMEQEGLSLDDVSQNPELAMLFATYGEDFFVAYGPEAPKAAEAGGKFLDRLIYHAARMAVYAGNAAVANNLDAAMSSPKNIFDQPLSGLPGDVIKFLATFDMPAYYQGMKVSDEDSRALARASLEAMPNMLGMIQIGVEEINLERSGVTFSGYKLSGKELCGAMTENDDLDMMSQMWGIKKRHLEDFKKIIARKNLIAVVGEMDGYIVLFVGNSEDDLVLVDDVNDSICASERIKYIDNYINNDLFAFGFQDGAMSTFAVFERMFCKLIGSAAQGFSDELENVDSLGDTEDLEVMLDSLNEKGRKIASMYKDADMAYVAYTDTGVRFEMYGGNNMPHVDMDAAHTLEPMSQGDGRLFFLNWTSDPQYNENLMKFIDTLGEVAYMSAKHILPLLASAEGEGDTNELSSTLLMFDELLREDLLEIWKALRTDMAEGLGAETALVVDLNGEMPKIPMLPKLVVDEGKMPRIAYVSTVDDRQKLQESWARLNKSLESLLKKANEMIGSDIPMQVPMSSEKDGLKTWFVPVPFQNDDFVPSISVSDDLFFATSSKKYAESLSTLPGKGGSGDRKGVWLHLDLEVAYQYLKEWYELIDKNAAELMSEVELDDFNANKEMIKAALDALSSLKDYSYHAREEDGQTRVSMHLKTK